MATALPLNATALSTLAVSSSLDELLDRVKTGNERIFVQRQGRTEAVLISVEDYIDLIAPAPEWLKESWKAAKEAGLDKMTMEEIDAEIAEVRRERQAREDAVAAAQ
jgi:prevent-host-death family protein